MHCDVRYLPAVEVFSSIKIWDEIENRHDSTLFIKGIYICTIWTNLGLLFSIDHEGLYVSCEEFLDKIPDDLATELLFHLDVLNWTDRYYYKFT